MQEGRNEHIPLEADGSQEMFDFTPFLFCYKRNLNSNSGMMVLCGMNPLFSWSVGSLNKAAIHLPAGFYVDIVLKSVGYISRRVIAGLHARTIFSFVRNCQTVFQIDCAIFYSYQQRIQVPVALFPC